VAGAAADEFHLNRVLFVPAHHPPIKAVSLTRRMRIASAWSSSLVRWTPRFEASRLEEGTERSYSIDTIEKVRAALTPGDELFFIIGADAFAEVRTWRRWQDVARAVRFLVVSRPGYRYDVPREVKSSASIPSIFRRHPLRCAKRSRLVTLLRVCRKV